MRRNALPRRRLNKSNARLKKVTSHLRRKQTETKEIRGQGDRGEEGQRTPFILKRRKLEKQARSQKKQKAQKTQVDPMVLTESDMEEIGDS